MSRFNVFLHKTDERLTLPKATRSLILVEIASDLEELFNHYVQQGLSEEEAAVRAEEKVDMSDEALSELVRIHSEAHGWTDRIVRRVHSFWERIALTVIVFYFVAVATLHSNQSLFTNVTIFIWPILAVFVGLIVVFVVQMVRFSDHPSPRRMRDGLAGPLFLGAASLVIGFMGTGIELYRTFMGMAAEPKNAGPLFAQSVLGVTATLAIALLVALAAGIVWFVLAGRFARLEEDAARTFLEAQ